MSKPEPDLNVNLLRDLVVWAAVRDNQVVDEEERFEEWGAWRQTTWARSDRHGTCGTAFCIAGQAVAQSGYVFRFFQAGDKFHADACAPGIQTGVDEYGKPTYRYDDAKLRLVPEVAQELLGLTADEADELFEADNSLGDIVRIAEDAATARYLDLNLPLEVAALRDEGY